MPTWTPWESFASGRRGSDEFRLILLDTNVVSEAMKPQPDPAVRRWLQQDAKALYISSVTVVELLFGVGALPDGRRKQQLAVALNLAMTLFSGRISPFDTDAARVHAELAVTARRAGRGFPMPDGYIAAIAGSRGFAVATRDIGAFDAVGIAVVNPCTVDR